MHKRKSLNDKVHNHAEYVQKLTEQLVGNSKAKPALQDIKDKSTAATGLSAGKDGNMRPSS